MMVIASSGDFFVEPSVGLLVMLVFFTAAVVTGLKGRWGWLLAGCVFGGLLWLISAWLAARPGSWWARRKNLSDPGETLPVGK